MKKWLSLPLVAGQIWAQNIDSEKALRARAEQFYQLEQDKKFRQADAFVAEDTKDLYFNSAKPNFSSFAVSKIELLDNNTQARVTVTTKSKIMMIGAGELPLETTGVALWKLENGEWVWHADPHAPIDTPFGKMSFPGNPAGTVPPNAAAAFGKMPDLDAIKKQVSIDNTSVVLTKKTPTASVTITNNMPGFVDVALGTIQIDGVNATVDNSRVSAGGKAVVQITAGALSKGDGNVRISVSPLEIEYDVHISVK